MRDQINRNNEFAEENINPTSHPATEKYKRWKSNIDDTLNPVKGSKKKDTLAKRRKKIKQMEEVIKEDIEGTKE